MKQVLQQVGSGRVLVEEVPAPRLLPGCVLVRMGASLVSAASSVLLRPAPSPSRPSSELRASLPLSWRRVSLLMQRRPAYARAQSWPLSWKRPVFALRFCWSSL